MRKLIKNILKEDEWDWVKWVEPELTKGLILCPNHEKFVGGCLEILKVDKRRDSHAPDKLVYLQSLETGKRYANTLKNMMQWVSDGEYVMSHQPLKESDGMEWIQDVKSNQDIAQEIADETKIKNDLLYTPFPPFPFSTVPLRMPYLHFPLFSTRLLSSFTKYYKEQYGLNDEDDINDVWERYKKLVRDKVNNINESDELQWIKDINPYIPFDGITLNTPYNIIIQDEDAFTETIENCDEDIDVGSISYVKVTSRTELTFRDIYCLDDGVDFWQGYKECLELKFYDKYDFMMLSHWFAPDGLIQFHHI